ncbi:hypothetical protein EMPS_04435 [Entomortierella parvispora]|uniref:Zincin n=1 Tax=Entomortierella parvispora TaxID=205924 RepID=A0A9P3H961_9FUNG|nr:hypothetical protein EMPS_04435 [Entomortierella parvispora]
MARIAHWIVAIGAALQCVQALNSSYSIQAVCTTEQCVLTAADILRDMNIQADPCQDFSEFACGGFNSRFEIPPDQSSYDNFNILHDETRRIVRSIVDANSATAPKAAAGDAVSKDNIAKFQGLYNSCMDQERLTQIGRSPLVDELQTVFNLFPVPDSSLKTQNQGAMADGGDNQQGESEEDNFIVSTAAVDKTALTNTLAYLNKMGIDSLISFSVSSDLENPSKRVLVLSEGGLGLPAKDYYKDKDTLAIYEKTVRQMFSLIFGKEPPSDATSTAATEDEDNWSAVAKDVVDFETQLAGIGTDLQDFYDPIKTYNPTATDSIGSMTPSIDWPLFLKNTLPSSVPAPKQIVVNWPAYQTKLEDLLQKTSPRTLQNYFAWNVIQARATTLGPEYQQPLRNLNSALSGSNSAVIPDRWKHCVSVVDGSLGDMVGHYFIQEVFKGNSKAQVSDIIQSLLTAYGKVFPKLDWLDKKTEAGAMKKLKAIVALVGYSTAEPNVTDSKSVQDYYKDLKVDPADFYGNQWREGVWSNERSFLNLNKPVNKQVLGSPPQTVNAFYSPPDNQIYFPAGILQPPFFHTGNPEYVNYGALGVVAGHEITHGFDNHGHLFDAQGRMVDWWTNSTTAAFNQKAQCFVDQYGNFTIKGPDGKDHNVDGHLTLGENIADNGGLKQSFNSWQARYKADKAGKKYMNQKLPGLIEYTPEQLYFVSYARVWCSKKRPAALLQQILTDVHSPARWRINGAVQNSEFFAKAFKCKVGAPMNPAKKCNLW